jgi:hypothetical protein
VFPWPSISLIDTVLLLHQSADTVLSFTELSKLLHRDLQLNIVAELAQLLSQHSLIDEIVLDEEETCHVRDRLGRLAV